MNIDRIVLAVAGSFIVISVILSQYHAIEWLWFTGFVGVNLFQSAFTGFCPMVLMLKKLGMTSGNAFK